MIQEGDFMTNKILCITDAPSFGKIALNAMQPILIHAGFNISSLPTALVSNTLDYGKFIIHDSTDYMKQTINIWNHLNIQFDYIATGFIINTQQAKIIKEYIKSQNSFVLVDPIMGDDGHLYPGIEIGRVEAMKELTEIADIIVHNYTEACLLLNKPYKEEGLDEEEIRQMINELRKNGAKKVVITSLLTSDHRNCVAGYDENYFIHYFDAIPVRFPGTGDIFASFLLSDINDNKTLSEACLHAMHEISAMILKYHDQEDKFQGIPLEAYIKETNNEKA